MLSHKNSSHGKSSSFLPQWSKNFLPACPAHRFSRKIQTGRPPFSLQPMAALHQGGNAATSAIRRSAYSGNRSAESAASEADKRASTSHARAKGRSAASNPSATAYSSFNSRLQRAYAEKSLALRFDFFDVMRYNKAKRKRILQYIQRQRYNFGGLGHGNRSARTAAKNFF